MPWVVDKSRYVPESWGSRALPTKLLTTHLGRLGGFLPGCKMRVRLLTLLIASTLLFGTLPCLGAEKSCSPETLLNPYSGVCAPINDVRSLYTMNQERHVSIQNIPSLTELRKENAVMRGLMPSDMPVPGGLGAGILLIFWPLPFGRIGCKQMSNFQRSTFIQYPIINIKHSMI